MAHAAGLSLFRADAFADRVVCVTGGAQGICEAVVRHLSGLGAAVVVLDRDAENLARVSADLEQAGAASLCLEGDIADSGVLERAVEQINSRWGRLDGWVNNAATGGPGSLADLSTTAFQDVLGLNLLAPWEALRHAAPLISSSGGGAVVNVSSVLAHRSSAGKAAYTASKAGLEGLTRALAVELAPQGIRVNSVVPGTIVTRQAKRTGPLPAGATDELQSLARRAQEGVLRDAQPLGRWGTPADVANVIVFLLSDMAGFMTGAMVAVDGGSLVDARYLKNQLDRCEVASDYQRYRQMLEKERAAGDASR